MIKKAFIMVSLFLMSVLILSACGTLRDTADKNEKLNETLPYYELNTADYSEISYDGTTYVITDICPEQNRLGRRNRTSIQAFQECRGEKISALDMCTVSKNVDTSVAGCCQYKQ